MRSGRSGPLLLPYDLLNSPRVISAQESEIGYKRLWATYIRRIMYIVSLWLDVDMIARVHLRRHDFTQNKNGVQISIEPRNGTCTRCRGTRDKGQAMSFNLFQFRGIEGLRKRADPITQFHTVSIRSRHLASPRGAAPTKKRYGESAGWSGM